MAHPVSLALLASIVSAFPLQAQTPLFVPDPGSPVTVGPGSGTVILRDVSRDGHLDMLTRHLLTRRIELLRGDGKGGFARLDSIVFEYEPGDMKLGDMNRDRIPDLVVTSNNRDFVDVLLGDGRGRFRLANGSPFTVSRVIDTYNKRTLHLLDLNEDGNLDIATANGRLRNTVRTLLGNGRGGFSPGPIVRLDTRGNSFLLAFGDVDGDGHQDVVTASSEMDSAAVQGRVAIQHGDGRGNFRSTRGSALLVPPRPTAITLADTDADGRLDIVTGHRGNLLSVLLNRGDGFQPTAGSPYDVVDQVYGLTAADVNGDQKADLLAATSTA